MGIYNDVHLVHARRDNAPDPNAPQSLVLKEGQESFRVIYHREITLDPDLAYHPKWEADQIKMTVDGDVPLYEGYDWYVLVSSSCTIFRDPTVYHHFYKVIGDLKFEKEKLVFTLE